MPSISTNIFWVDTTSHIFGDTLSAWSNYYAPSSDTRAFPECVRPVKIDFVPGLQLDSRPAGRLVQLDHDTLSLATSLHFRNAPRRRWIDNPQ